MDSFDSYLLRKLYVKTSRNGDRLASAEKQLDWERFRPIIKPMYTKDTHRGGRPNTDPVVMMKLLVLQAWYGLSDPELQRQVADRISVQRFFGFPGQPLDYSTI
ncbi:MAG: transposase [Candidatus Bathyarchaeota archaeon]